MKSGGDGSSRSPLARRNAVAIVGGVVTVAGIAMLVLPGPAIVVIPLGLSILATEFVWARRYLRRCRVAIVRWKDKVKSRAQGSSRTGASSTSSAVPAVRRRTPDWGD
jgi:uncharacterized protein (TIGR02611 family)